MPTAIIPTDADAAHAMRQCGSIFARALADLWLCGNPMQQARVKEAFRPEFDQFREDARMRKIDDRARAEAIMAFDQFSTGDGGHAPAIAATDRTGEERLPDPRDVA